MVNTAKKLNLEVHLARGEQLTYGGGTRYTKEWCCTVSLNGTDFYSVEYAITKVGAYRQAVAKILKKLEGETDKLFDELITTSDGADDGNP